MLRAVRHASEVLLLGHPDGSGISAEEREARERPRRAIVGGCAVDFE